MGVDQLREKICKRVDEEIRVSGKSYQKKKENLTNRSSKSMGVRPTQLTENRKNRLAKLFRILTCQMCRLDTRAVLCLIEKSFAFIRPVPLSMCKSFSKSPQSFVYMNQNEWINLKRKKKIAANHRVEWTLKSKRP